MAGEIAQSADIDGTDLLNEHTRGGSIDFDLRPEGRWHRAGRSWRHEHDRTWEEGIGLHNDTEASPPLFVPNTLGEAQNEDVTPTHGGAP